ncbi:hypothetical protein B0920_03140 [Massilia sp. KIM]|uniref:RES family NAD+ phosphorylase n=1 Tax=Massilia sp. KIM TaxID=1955422 RepID=UPI00098EC785|nr:RES family NAD+ phosphorylase [Massilia sp. KIM]OON62469.1 hypothetical protein B0920_03140 [Massilia sp. KIM]
MSKDYSNQEFEVKRICDVCVVDAFLAEYILREVDEATCSYCGEVRITLPLTDIADRVETAFDEHYHRTSDQPSDYEYMLLADRESSYEWSREGLCTAEAIAGASGMSESVANDIQEILADRHWDLESAQMGEETAFAADAYYEEKSVSAGSYTDEWILFEASLKTEARFFSRAAAAHLADVFGGIDKLTTIDGRPLVVTVGPGCQIDHLYRGRVFQSDDTLTAALKRPDTELGPPPAKFAGAGRMNAPGISVFYGADKAEVVVAEVRPPVGSKVAVAKFEITRQLHLLDLTALPKIYESGSIFDPGFGRRLERAAFLRSLGKQMTRPVMPGDEALDYLATQATADFLATENKPLLDGIIFPSVQAREGRNIVLFHKSARVEPLDTPEGTSISTSVGHSTEEGWETGYTVYEEVQEAQGSNHKDVAEAQVRGAQTLYPDELFLTDPLRVDPSSVVVHHVQWVNYHCEPHAVDRHRYTRAAESDSSPFSFDEDF